MFGKKSGGMDTPAFGDAHLATGGEMHTAGLLETKGIRLGYYRTPGDRTGWGQVIRYNGDGGLILVAPPRSGKARDVLVGALLEYDQSVIVVDPKGQLAAITKDQRERMGQRVVVLNPFKVWPEILGPTARYNPMALLDPTSPTFGAECRKLAEGLVAPSSNERDSHWTDGARTLISSVIGHLIVGGDEEDRNLAEMRQMIAGPEAVLLKFAQDGLNSPHAFIRQGLAEYAVDNAPNKAEIAGKISSAREQTFFLSIDTIADNIRGDDFRFGVLKKEPVTVYVILPDEHLDTCGKWFRLVVASALHDLWRGGRGACRVLAILDEFAHIGHLDILEKAAGMAAGHGLQLWPVLQNLTQLKKDYGDNWETFIAGSEIRQFFATRDQTSAKYVSETSGQRTVTTAGQSIQNTKLLEQNQSSDSAGQAGQPLIRPHEINGFGPNESLIFGPRNIVVDGLRQPYFHTPEFAGLYSPDPQHRADASPPPPLNPESVVTFADTHVAGLERSARALAAKRPLFLRLLTWGTSSNPALNIARKIEYVVTFPLRLVAALVAAPFAIHNRPLGALLGFLALFGFWEVWESFAKEPFLAVYSTERQVCSNTRWAADGRLHPLACNVTALRNTLSFLADHTLLAVWKSGLGKAATDFDLAMTQERDRNLDSASRVGDRIVVDRVGYERTQESVPQLPKQESPTVAPAHPIQGTRDPVATTHADAALMVPTHYDQDWMIDHTGRVLLSSGDSLLLTRPALNTDAITPGGRYDVFGLHINVAEPTGFPIEVSVFKLGEIVVSEVGEKQIKGKYAGVAITQNQIAWRAVFCVFNPSGARETSDLISDLRAHGASSVWSLPSEPNRSIVLVDISESLGPLMRRRGALPPVPFLILKPEQVTDARLGVRDGRFESQTLDLSLGVRVVLRNAKGSATASNNWIVDRERPTAMVLVVSADGRIGYVPAPDYLQCGPVDSEIHKFGLTAR